MKRKVLLVDSVSSILEREKSLLARDHFSVYTANTGQEALEAHRREEFDLIVLDHDLAGMSCEEACKAIRKVDKGRKVSLLVTTTDESQPETDALRKAGADAFIKKPVRKDEFNEKLAKLLGVPTRQAIRILVRIKLDGKSGSDFFIANTVDVSATGMLFECATALKLGSIVEASFFLPGKGSFNRVVVQAEVVRCVPGNGSASTLFGVRFVDFKEGGKITISEFVKEKTVRSGQD